MRAFPISLAVVAACGIVLTGSTTWAEQKPVPVDQLPTAVVLSLKTRFPAGELVRAVKDEEGGDVEYFVTVKNDGKSTDVTLSAGGGVKGMAKELAVKDLPEVVTAAIEKKFPKAEFKRMAAIYEKKEKDGKLELQFYAIALATADGQVAELRVGPDGKIDVANDESNAFTNDFSAEKPDLVSTGKNPFFVLEPGYQLFFEGGEKEQLTITVLDETKTVDGVETRVVEERGTKNGELVEVSRNYFAISKRTNSVYYLGEDVDTYKEGKVEGHAGTWLTGQKNARFGLFMPGLPLVGARYHQETAPGDAMDRSVIASVNRTVKVPAGEFKNCLQIIETTPLDPNERDEKVYAPGVGLAQAGAMGLVRYGKVDLPKK